MNIGADEEPYEGEEPVIELSVTANFSRSVRWYKYGAKLECGCTHWDATPFPEIYSKQYHWFDCIHGGGRAVDFVSMKPEVDRWGRT